MGFIANDEFIILMDYADHDQFYRPLQPDEIKRFGEVGIRTVYRNLHWREIEKAPGQFVWDDILDYIQVAWSAGLKVVLAVGDMVPDFYPPSWYPRKFGGVDDGSYICRHYFSPWHPEAQAQKELFLGMCRDYLNTPDVLCVKSGAHSGEALLSWEPAYFDPEAIADHRWRFGRDPAPIPHGLEHAEPTYTWLKERLLAQALGEQTILVQNPTRTIFSNLHACWRGDPASGNDLIDELYQEYNQIIHPDAFYGIMFAYFWVGDMLKSWQIESAQKAGQQLFIGSETCRGLQTNTEAAIQSGARGFLTGPLCPDRGYPWRRAEDWMYEAVPESLAKWRAARL